MEETVSRPTIARRGRRALTLATVAGVAVATLATSGSAQATSSPATAAAPGTGASGSSSGQDAAPLKAGNYIVTMLAPPAASYDGGVAGMAATRPAHGRRLDARTTAVQRYRQHLLGQQSALLRKTGVKAGEQYTVALNGFAARLTAAQAAKLAGSRGVLSVTPDTRRKPDLFETPKFLGLQGPAGTWNQVGGVDRAGKGVVVGVLDTGIWPENPSFAGAPVKRTTPGGAGSTYLKDGKIHVVKKDGGEFVGECQAGDQFYATTCNSKLVGARFYASGFVNAVPADKRGPFEFLSPRDGDGHGSHTSSTAVGNQISGMVVNGRQFGRSSGMAPAAKLATYKVCWDSSQDDLDGCYSSDMIAAVEDAVTDGVDVINFSIGGDTPESASDPLEITFLNAAAAGVFVAASAGNSGPGDSTVGHNSPWLTTVAAGSAHRLEGTVQLGDGAKLRGASFNATALPAKPAILGSAAAASGATAAAALLCTPDTLDPAKVTGKIVVCDRGTVDRVAKSAEVKRAGGVGLVMTNPSPNSLNADVHAVPTVHVQDTDRAAIVGYLGTANPTIALLVGDQTGKAPTPLPVVAGFSSRGPDLTSGGDLLKPDITAPGVDIVAAVAPGPHRGDSFDVESGTSMSSPHVAGLAALILGKRPDWSPATVKSAMMTTATDTRTEAGGKNTNPFDQGAGFVNPRRFLEPGLVYDAGFDDWAGYLEGVGLDTGTGLPAIDPSDVNVPSIAIGALAGTQTVKRRVTAIRSGTYHAFAKVPGVTTVVEPSVLRLRKGQTAEFTVTFTRKQAALDTYATGFLTWVSGYTAVRSPIAVRPVPLAAPAEVSGSGASGSKPYQVQAGTTGSIDLTVSGLAAGTVRDDSVAAGAADPTPPGNAANKVYEVTIPAGTNLARFDEVAGDAADDLDLYVFDDSFQLVAYSATGAASERVDMPDPAAGTYHVLVNGFATNDGQPAAFSLRSFNVGAAAGNLTATPDPLPVTLGQAATVTLGWSGLTAGTPYLGTVGYSGSDARTIVSIG
jgi:subtilisin family serine protease